MKCEKIIVAVFTVLFMLSSVRTHIPLINAVMIDVPRTLISLSHQFAHPPVGDIGSNPM